MKKNSCTQINPKKYLCYGLKKIHTRNLITKKIPAARKSPPHNFSDGPSLRYNVLKRLKVVFALITDEFITIFLSFLSLALRNNLESETSYFLKKIRESNPLETPAEFPIVHFRVRYDR